MRVNPDGSSVEEHPILKSGKPMMSCLKGSRLSNKEQRTDRRGSVIVEGQRKSFKISYVDKVDKGTPLAEVHLVESYKKYNAEDPHQPSSPCCSLF